MSKNKITIRKATSGDAEAISTILIGTQWFEHLVPTLQEETVERIQRQIESCANNNSHTIIVAENPDGMIVGYAACNWLPTLFLKSPEGYVSEMFVHNQYRGQSVGRRLCETLINEARERNCSRLMLITSRQRESYQREFYKKLGWEEREDIANFIFEW